MGLVRSTVFTGLLASTTAAAYLAARNPVVSPLPKSDPVWSDKVYRRYNANKNEPTQDIVIRRLPIRSIKPELLNKDGDLVVAFCRGVWSGPGYAVQRKYLEYKYRADTPDQLWDTAALSTSNYDKGTRITDHFEVVDKTPTSITVRCGDSPRNAGPRPSDGLFVIGATVDKAHEQVELTLKSVLFSSDRPVTGIRGPMPPWMEELHQWYGRIWSETASWKVRKW